MTTTPLLPRTWTAVEACHAAGITYRQCDYWTRTGLLGPDTRRASGSGNWRAYSRPQLRRMQIFAAVSRIGVKPSLVRPYLQAIDDLPPGTTTVTIQLTPDVQATITIRPIP